MRMYSRLRNAVAITGVGGYVPDHVLSNSDLEEMVDTSDDWIVSRTGIRERRILKEKGLGTSYLCVQAIRNLFSKKEIDPKTVDAVILATITPDVLVAPTAAYVVSEIGASNAFGFDLGAACSGFLYGLSVATTCVASGRYKRVILVGADMMSSIVDYSDRATCILFGDGAGAVLLEASPNAYGIEDEYLRSDGSNRSLLQIKSGGSLYPTSMENVQKGWHRIYQDGQAVYKHAVSGMLNATETIMNRNNLDKDELDFLLPHQANKRIIDATANRIGISSDKVLMNIDRYGNTTAATIPLLLHDFEHRFKKGSKLIITTFGGGFTWGSTYLTWAYD